MDEKELPISPQEVVSEIPETTDDILSYQNNPSEDKPDETRGDVGSSEAIDMALPIVPLKDAPTIATHDHVVFDEAQVVTQPVKSELGDDMQQREIEQETFEIVDTQSIEPDVNIDAVEPVVELPIGNHEQLEDIAESEPVVSVEASEDNHDEFVEDEVLAKEDFNEAYPVDVAEEVIEQPSVSDNEPSDEPDSNENVESIKPPVEGPINAGKEHVEDVAVEEPIKLESEHDVESSETEEILQEEAPADGIITESQDQMPVDELIPVESGPESDETNDQLGAKSSDELHDDLGVAQQLKLVTDEVGEVADEEPVREKTPGMENMVAEQVTEKASAYESPIVESGVNEHPESVDSIASPTNGEIEQLEDRSAMEPAIGPLAFAQDIDINDEKAQLADDFVVENDHRHVAQDNTVTRSVSEVEPHDQVEAENRPEVGQVELEVNAPAMTGAHESQVQPRVDDGFKLPTVSVIDEIEQKELPTLAQELEQELSELEAVPSIIESEDVPDSGSDVVDSNDVRNASMHAEVPAQQEQNWNEREFDRSVDMTNSYAEDNAEVVQEEPPSKGLDMPLTATLTKPVDENEQEEISEPQHATVDEKKLHGAFPNLGAWPKFPTFSAINQDAAEPGQVSKSIPPEQAIVKETSEDAPATSPSSTSRLSMSSIKGAVDSLSSRLGGWPRLSFGKNSQEAAINRDVQSSDPPKFERADSYLDRLEQLGSNTLDLHNKPVRDVVASVSSRDFDNASQADNSTWEAANTAAEVLTSADGDADANEPQTEWMSVDPRSDANPQDEEETVETSNIAQQSTSGAEADNEESLQQSTLDTDLVIDEIIKDDQGDESMDELQTEMETETEIARLPEGNENESHSETRSENVEPLEPEAIDKRRVDDTETDDYVAEVSLDNVARPVAEVTPGPEVSRAMEIPETPRYYIDDSEETDPAQIVSHDGSMDNHTEALQGSTVPAELSLAKSQVQLAESDGDEEPLGTRKYPDSKPQNDTVPESKENDDVTNVEVTVQDAKQILAATIKSRIPVPIMKAVVPVEDRPQEQAASEGDGAAEQPKDNTLNIKEIPVHQSSDTTLLDNAVDTEEPRTKEHEQPEITETAKETARSAESQEEVISPPPVLTTDEAATVLSPELVSPSSNLLSKTANFFKTFGQAKQEQLGQSYDQPNQARSNPASPEPVVANEEPKAQSSLQGLFNRFNRGGPRSRDVSIHTPVVSDELGPNSDAAGEGIPGARMSRQVSRVSGSAGRSMSRLRSVEKLSRNIEESRPQVIARDLTPAVASDLADRKVPVDNEKEHPSQESELAGEQLAESEPLAKPVDSLETVIAAPSDTVQAKATSSAPNTSSVDSAPKFGRSFVSARIGQFNQTPKETPSHARKEPFSLFRTTIGHPTNRSIQRDVAPLHIVTPEPPVDNKEDQRNDTILEASNGDESPKAEAAGNIVLLETTEVSDIKPSNHENKDLESAPLNAPQDDSRSTAVVPDNAVPPENETVNDKQLPVTPLPDNGDVSNSVSPVEAVAVLTQEQQSPQQNASEPLPMSVQSTEQVQHKQYNENSTAMEEGQNTAIPKAVISEPAITEQTNDAVSVHSDDNIPSNASVIEHPAATQSTDPTVGWTSAEQAVPGTEPGLEEPQTTKVSVAVSTPDLKSPANLVVPTQKSELAPTVVSQESALFISPVTGASDLDYGQGAPAPQHGNIVLQGIDQSSKSEEKVKTSASPSVAVPTVASKIRPLLNVRRANVDRTRSPVRYERGRSQSIDSQPSQTGPVALDAYGRSRSLSAAPANRRRERSSTRRDRETTELSMERKATPDIVGWMKNVVGKMKFRRDSRNLDQVASQIVTDSESSSVSLDRPKPLKQQAPVSSVEVTVPQQPSSLASNSALSITEDLPSTRGRKIRKTKSIQQFLKIRGSSLLSRPAGVLTNGSNSQARNMSDTAGVPTETVSTAVASGPHVSFQTPQPVNSGKIPASSMENVEDGEDERPLLTLTQLQPNANLTEKDATLVMEHDKSLPPTPAPSTIALTNPDQPLPVEVAVPAKISQERQRSSDASLYRPRRTSDPPVAEPEQDAEVPPAPVVRKRASQIEDIKPLTVPTNDIFGDFFADLCQPSLSLEDILRRQQPESNNNVTTRQPPNSHQQQTLANGERSEPSLGRSRAREADNDQQTFYYAASGSATIYAVRSSSLTGSRSLNRNRDLAESSNTNSFDSERQRQENVMDWNPSLSRGPARTHSEKRRQMEQHLVYLQQADLLNSSATAMKRSSLISQSTLQPSTSKQPTRSGSPARSIASGNNTKVAMSSTRTPPSTPPRSSSLTPHAQSLLEDVDASMRQRMHSSASSTLPDSSSTNMERVKTIYGAVDQPRVITLPWARRGLTLSEPEVRVVVPRPVSINGSNENGYGSSYDGFDNGGGASSIRSSMQHYPSPGPSPPRPTWSRSNAGNGKNSLMPTTRRSPLRHQQHKQHHPYSGGEGTGKDGELYNGQNVPGSRTSMEIGSDVSLGSDTTWLASYLSKPGGSSGGGNA
ncbi:hypothetical protein HDU76_000515 [Blyttiomyces sp. JEL0837]|nr:hypothetical protein HDU76_000515 [Blyttiomyces sp. JEL0837]